MAQLILEAGRSETQYWRDLWRYRELFYVLAWRDISVKYKQTAIGVLWALIQPVATTLIFTFIFGRVANMPSGGVPYAILVSAGMLPWQFFSNAVSSSSQSLVTNSNLISKVYFPRLIVPASAVATSSIDFLISFLVTIGIMAYYHYLPPIQILLLPFFIALAFLSALGPGLIITALNVKYRDFRIIVPFLIQFGIYVSPVGFTSAIVEQKSGMWGRLAYSLNPVVGVIDGFRWCILGGANTIFWPGFLLSLTVTALLLFLGVRYFRSTEKSFADVI
jgi:lipopolysaccharide transport system permease protein